MGKIERKIKADIRRTKVNRAIIGTLSVAGVVAVGLLAPNILGAMDKLGALKSQRRQSVKRSLSRLIERGYVELRTEDGRKRLRLTQTGER